MKSPFTQTELARRCFSTAAEYADAYDGSTPHALFFRERLRLVLDFLAAIGNGKLLDVGCGPGILLSHLAGGPLDTFGLDLSSEMIAEASARTAGRNVSLTVGDLKHLPYDNGTFDVILGLGVLEYLTDQRAALREIARIAKPSAVVILSMVNKVSLYRRWERLISNPLHRLRSQIRGRSRCPQPRMWMQSEKSLTRMMRDCNLAPVDTVYYDLNVCVAPFDSKYPRQASVLNDWVRTYRAHWLFPLVHTAFLVRAHRSTSWGAYSYA